MPETPKKRRSNPTRELLKQVLAGQCRIEERFDGVETRMSRIEAAQTLTNNAWQRQGSTVDEINRRCMEKLGMQCPLTQDDDDDDDGNTNDGGATTQNDS